MSPAADAFDAVLLITAALLAFAVGVELLRGGWRERQDRRSLDRLRPAAPAERDEERLARPLGPVERRLRAAAMPVGPLAFWSASAFLAAAAAAGLLALLPIVPFAAVSGGLLTFTLPWSLAGIWARRRAARFESGLSDALGFMVGSLEAGENPLQAFASAAEASTGAVRKELAEVANRLRFGMSIQRALRPVVEGYDSEGVRLFAQSVAAKWQAGGDLVPILQSVARVVRERLAVRLHLRSHLAGARVVAVMIAALPYAVIPVYLWRMPSLIERLVNHPLGPSLLTFAVMLQVVGWLWLGRILRVEL
ncbi:MAG TPA: type II secretion system F family protein [Thermoanaerobaculia bacterium]